MERSREKRQGVRGLYVLKGLTGIADADWERYFESLKPQSAGPSTANQVARDIAADFHAGLTETVRTQQTEVHVSHTCPSNEAYAHSRAYWQLVQFLESKGLEPSFDQGISYNQGSFRNYFVLSLILSPPAES